MDRRAFLKLGATSVLVGSGCATIVSPEAMVAPAVDFTARSPRRVLAPREVRALGERHGDFPLGVMSGDATTDRAILWTRYTGNDALVLWVKEVGADALVQLDVATGPDGYTHVDVRGLRAGRTYRYAFLVRERDAVIRRGPSGRFRTPPEPDALIPVTFAGTSCTNQFIRPYPAMAHAAARGDLDFFVHAGDHVYCDFSHSLDEYRLPYSLAWPSYGMKGLHAAVGSYATWDDHEVGNNWDPETWNPAQVANARRAFFEHHPIRRDAEFPQRMWRSFRWGQSLEVFVLDCRGERRPSTRSRPDGEYLSRAQMNWLKQGLTRSDARFKMIVNSVPITNFPGIYDLLASDRWEGYPAQREELLGFITRERIDGTWFLSGDFHFGSIAHVEPSGPYGAIREVLMGPGRQHINSLWSGLEGPQWDYLCGENNYSLFKVDPIRDTLEVSFVGEYGEQLVRRVYPRDAARTTRVGWVRA